MVYAPLQYLTPEQRNHLKRVSISYQKRSFTLILAFEGSKSGLLIEYRQDGKDTMVEYNKTEEPVKGQDFVSVFCEDLKAMLMNTEKVLQGFGIGYPNAHDWDDDYRVTYVDPIGHRLFRYLETYLQSRNPKLQVACFGSNINRIDQISMILSYLDEETLKEVNFRKTSNIFYSNPADVNELLQLNQWKQFKYLKLRGSSGTISLKTLLLLKEMLLKDIFIDGQIEYKHIDKKGLDLFFGFSNASFETREDKQIIRSRNSESVIIEIARGLISFYRKMLYEDGEQHYRVLYKSNRKKSPAKIVDDFLLDDPRCMAVFENPLILKNVLKYFKCYHIQALRKVSSGIRKCVDHVKPDPNNGFLTIGLSFLARIHVSSQLQSVYTDSFEYNKMEDKCTVYNYAWATGKVPIEVSGNLWTIFFNDLKLMFKYQKTCLRWLRVAFSYYPCFQNVFKTELLPGSASIRQIKLPLVDYNLLKSQNDQFLEKFKMFLKDRTEPLKVETLAMTILTQFEMLEVLPYIDRVSLKRIEISYANKWINTNAQIQLDALFELDQWKQAEELIISNFSVSTPIQQLKIFNFSAGDMILETISSEDLLYLKQGFLNSTSLIKFKITLKNSTVDETVYDLMGWPYRKANPLLRNQKDIWFFRMPKITNSVLHIIHNVSRSIFFSRVELSAVPEDLNLM